MHVDAETGLVNSCKGIGRSFRRKSVQDLDRFEVRAV